ncbi:MAG: hypothetical protein ACRDO8_02290 [Nocardioidaceae bacterium]
MSAGLRDWLAHPSTKVAIALVVAGILFVLVVAQSQSRLYWTGQAVAGTNSGGIVYYKWHGEEFTVDDPATTPAHATPVTVYVDPDDPGHALLARPVRWVDAGAVLIWFVAAAVLLIVSALRRRQQERRRPASGHSADAFGEGLDSDWVQRHLEQSRRPPRRPPEQ